MKQILRGGPVMPGSGVLRPLGFDEITLRAGFWNDKQELNAVEIISHCEEWVEKIGWLSNFDRAASGTIAANHVGIEFVDSEVYKLLEGMAWELGRAKDPDLERRYSAIVQRVVAAQEPDGYLHTSFGRPGQPPRYSNLEWGHELYCFGHLIQAAVARLRSGEDDALPAAARRLAEHLYREFGPEGRNAICGHPEIEVALVELYRATRESKHLELASLFIERRGSGSLDSGRFGAEYFQDDIPVRSASVLRGHAVRALYLASGAIDVAVENSDDDLARAIETQWSNTVARRTYITGGMGAHHADEAFGEDYELPPDRAYAETCAGIASVMLSWRLLLHTGDEKYADLIERTLLNNVLASPRSDGHAFFYTNTLHQRVPGSEPDADIASERAESNMRAPWFEVSCCPTNVARTLASVGLYFATATAAGVQLHQYGSYDISTLLDDGPISLGVRSSYPFDGDVVVGITKAPASESTISFRIPAWAKESATIEWNGVSRPVNGAVAVVTATFAPGDEIVLRLPTSPRMVEGAAAVDAIRGTFAVERGPLVLCLESLDLPPGWGSVNEVQLAGLRLEGDAAGTRAPIQQASAPASEWPYASAPPSGSEAIRGPEWVNLVPYFEWANRGPSTMRVWLPNGAPKTPD